MTTREWPTIIVTGPRGAGKTEFCHQMRMAMLLEMADGDSVRGRVIEAHVWSPLRLLGNDEIVLATVAEAEAVFERYPECVLVWVEAPLDMRHTRLEKRDGSDTTPHISMMDQEEADFYTKAEVIQNQIADQIVHNTENKARLRRLAELVLERYHAKFYGVSRLQRNFHHDLGSPRAAEAEPVPVSDYEVVINPKYL
jgi:dephospho-CoA kinase